MSSILTSIKKLLGIDEGDISFDVDIIMHINSTFFVLNQLGLGPTTGFTIADKTAIWTDIIGSRIDVESVKSYMYLQVRLIFDPPQTSFAIDAIKSSILQAEWRITNQLEEVT
jgi:hypothetical protein